MQQKTKLYFSSEIVLFPLLLLMIIWIAFWLELNYGWKFLRWGIYPQTVEGLKGIVFAPFVHGSLKHLFNNSIPLFALTAALFYFYRSIRWKVLLWGTLLTGLMTWVIARPAMHIGASGVVYMLAAFLFFKGIFSRKFQLTAISLIVVFLYGGMFWYLFPVDPKISWEGHLSGFIVGFIFALLFRSQEIENPKYAWEKEDYNPEEDAFLRHFDEDGNFIETLPDETEVDQEGSPKITIRYTLKERPKKDASD